MKWLSDMLRRRRMRKDIAEAIVMDVLRGCDFSEQELEWLLVGGPEHPLGDVFAGEHFLTNPFRQIKYMHFLAWLMRACGESLCGQGVVPAKFASETPQEIVVAVDPLLDYLLNVFRSAFESEHGPGTAGRETMRAFQALPRDKCGPKAFRNIQRIEKDQKLMEFMKRFVDDSDH